MKIVINKGFGGFTLSEFAANLLGVDKWGCYPDSDDEIERNNPALISLCEAHGTDICSGPMSELRIVEIPDDVDWQIDQYDGDEWIAETHRTWE